jgi:ABC-type nitrate/sulfonate/bicarbonate transport system permease component
MRRTLPPPFVARLLVVVLLGIAWEIGGRFTSKLYFRPLSEVTSAGWALLAEASVRHAILTTFWELALAFALSVVIGITLGLIVAANRMSYQSLYPIVLLIYAIPQITILPLFVLYFGPGPASKVAFGVSHGLFPIMLKVIGEYQSVNQVLLRTARSMGASRRKTFHHIVFPSLVPGLFTGMRLAMTASLLGVMLAELYVTSGGSAF